MTLCVSDKLGETRNRSRRALASRVLAFESIPGEHLVIIHILAVIGFCLALLWLLVISRSFRIAMAVLVGIAIAVFGVLAMLT
jgi:uncharacterized membrane protein